MQKLRQVVLLIIAVSMILSCGTAIAQDEEKEDEFMLEEIVVTGSRIVRRDFESSSPIVTIEAGTFEERSNIGLESALNQLPQFVPAGTQAIGSDAGTPFPAATATPGAATVNLRGLGTNRTLVLVDGKRVQPINAMLVVDLNTIPSAAVESVEVITGGAAAVYGADAIAGVVNLKLKKDFEGAVVDVQYGITQEGDGQELQFNGLLGSGLAGGRGNIMLGFSYSDREKIMGKDRDWVTDGWKDPGTDSGGITTSNLTTFNPDAGNMPAAGWGAASYTVDQNNNVFSSSDPLDPAHPYTGPLGYGTGFKVNPDGTLAWIDPDERYLQIPMERYSIFGSGRFDLTDTTEFYMDVRYSKIEVLAVGGRQGYFNIWGIDMPYNQLYDDPDSPQFGQAPSGTAQHPVPAALADLLNSRPDPDAPWNYESGMHFLPPYQTKSTSNVFQIGGGLRGEFGFGFEFMDDWTWDVYYSHGESTLNAQQHEGFTHYPRSQEVFEADQYGKGFSGAYPIAVTANCTSGIPVFNEDGSFNASRIVSQDCADYMTLRMNSITTLKQNVFEANMQGSIVELPAGALQFAAGVGYREEEFQFNPDTGYNANQSFPNAVGNLALPVPVRGNTDVSEIYGELLIPILRDLPFIKSLSVEPGWRQSDYSISEKVETYKLMADWAVNDWVRFRGGVQKANRAPNIAELFTPKGSSSIAGIGGTAVVDTCGSWDQVPDWGNKDTNPNRYNLQVLCQHLMVRDGAPEDFDKYVPGGSANDWKWNVLGKESYFPYVLAVKAGNPNLESEEADTTTLGIVINSPFKTPALNNMRLSVDYYKAEVEGAIGVPEHMTVYQQCMDAQYNSLIGSAPGTYTGEQLAAGSPFCALINREYLDDGINDFGADRKFQAAYINQGALVSEGYDVQINWGSDFADIGLDFVPGHLGVNMLLSVLEEFSVAPFPGADVIDYTGTTVGSSFDYKMFTTFNYSVGGFSGGLRWMHLPELDPEPGSASDVKGVNAYNQFDLFARYIIGDNLEVRGGIDNLLYAEPEVIGANSTNNARGSSIISHDTFGRRFYVAVKYSF